MPWKPIVAAVDGSRESARAAAVAAELAQAAGTTFDLVHATPDQWLALPGPASPERAERFRRMLIAEARERVEHAMLGMFPPDVIQRMVVRVGRAAAVLKKIAVELDAGLIVMGGKHHSAVSRWLAGSTSIDMVRMTEVPVFVTGDHKGPIRRVLAAVDMSAATRPTIEAAERMAQMLGADLRVICAIEPVPVIPDRSSHDFAHYYSMMEDQIARNVWSLLKSTLAEKVMRYGAADDVILQEAADWGADLVVVGSHGKGLVDRLLIGSVTERLLNRLPTSLLIVPVYAVVAAQELERQSAWA